MNYSVGMITGFGICISAGIWLLMGHGAGRWSLKYRARLRSGITGAVKYESWKEFLESGKGARPAAPLIRLLRKYREGKIDREIFESITFLRNMASLEKGRNSSADFIIEQLSQHNGLLRPVLIRMLNLLRLNRTREAAELFAQKAGTPAARDFAGLLIRWDKLAPGELMGTLLSYEKSMKAARLTDQKRRDEITSDLIYLPVVVNILVIFVNFIYIAYFIDQKEMLQMFF